MIEALIAIGILCSSNSHHDDRLKCQRGVIECFYKEKNREAVKECYFKYRKWDQ